MTSRARPEDRRVVIRLATQGPNGRENTAPTPKIFALRPERRNITGIAVRPGPEDRSVAQTILFLIFKRPSRYSRQRRRGGRANLVGELDMYENAQPIDRSLVKARPAHLNPDPIGILEDYPRLQPAFFRLRKIFTNTRKDYVQACYQAGVVVLESCRDEDVRREMPGDRPIKAWADALGVSTRILHECRRVAETFTPQEIETIVEMQGVTWAHVCAVTVVTSDAERKRLLTLTSENGLNVDELMLEIVPGTPRKPRAPRRAPAIPKNAKQGLARVEKASIAFARQLQEAWFCPEFDLPGAVSWIPDEKLTPDTCEQLNRTIQSFESISGQSPEILARLREAVRQIDEVLQRRGEET